MINRMKMNITVIAVMLLASVLSSTIDNGGLRSNTLSFSDNAFLNALSVSMIYIILLVLVNIKKGLLKKVCLIILMFGLATEIAAGFWALPLNIGFNMVWIIVHMLLALIAARFTFKEFAHL